MAILTVGLFIIIIGMLIYTIVISIKDKFWIMAIIIGIITVFLIGFAGYLGYDDYQISKCTIQTQNITADITDRQYRSSFVTTVKSGKVMVPVVHSAEYNVTLHYDKVSSIIDDETLYESNLLTVKAKLKTYIKPNKDIYKQEIVLDQE